MSDSREDHTSDLDALFEDLPPEEADRLREIWDLSADATPEGEDASVDTEAALDRVLKRLGEPDEATSSSASGGHDRDRAREGAPDRDPRPRAKSRNRSAWGIPQGAGTAVVVLLLVGAVFAYWWQQPITQTAPRGQQVTLTLSDGSEVELNSGSVLRYERSFGDVRSLYLDGEAFFAVASDERPFVVRTFNATVHATGTAFNVEARSDAPTTRTQVTLVEGTVTVRPEKEGAETTRMRPGETRRIQDRAGRLSSPLDMSVEEATAWRRGELIAKDRPLAGLLPEVERRFGVDLRVHPDSLRQKRISLALRHTGSAEAVVRDVALVLGLEYRETANGFVLHR